MNCNNEFEKDTLSKLEYKGITYELRDKSKIPLSEKGTPDGVATLDSNGLIPQSQIGNSIRYGTTAEWDADISFIPQRGQIIVYSDKGKITKDDTEIRVPAFKVGDGLAYLVDLPFVGDDEVGTIMSLLKAHTDNDNIHVTTDDKDFWSNKINCELEDEVLVFNRM